jgi:uncharacterized protein YdeI (YjbR/CyaY-like superfamily)
MDIGETLLARSPADFRRWLAHNAQSRPEVWLAIYKKASGKTGITYEQAVETALCFGWIDGLVKSLDQEKYAQRFTPRRPGSHWTEANLQKARRLIAAGRMTAAGLAALPPDLEK